MKNDPNRITWKGKPARVLGTVPGWVVVQVGSERPIVISYDEYDDARRQGGG